QAACRGVDTVFHLGAIASVVSSVADPVTAHDVNVTGTLNILMAARDRNVRRLVFASSASVYGNAQRVPTSETEPLKPESPYATGKACGEFYCRNFWELYGLETVMLRYFNVFGPGQSPVGGYAAVIPMWAECAATGARPVIYGDGRQTRDFVYVGNVVAANVLAATAQVPLGQAFNVAAGTGVSLLDLLSEFRALTGSPMSPEFRPGREGEVRHSIADIARARHSLSYQPEVSLRAGLAATLFPGSAPLASRHSIPVSA
ncbi:MAG TPA: NAD-dependent epimerase/dehydratase family protein, partial [Armatimonadota bacterium]|nr:NAD-dependent epimerase/dehydratase family protein [Armatimonadota bacterium]